MSAPSWPPDQRTLLPMGLYGLGRVGTAFAARLRDAGYALITGTRSKEAPALAELARTVRVLWLMVSDPALEEVARQVAFVAADRDDLLVVQSSGSLPASILRPEGARFQVAGFHPLVSFPTAEDGARALAGAFIGIEAAPETSPVLEAIARDLGATPLPIDGGHKALYHAAACVASNYLVTLMELASRMMRAAGAPEALALPALGALAEGTLRNVLARGPAAALTGPIARGDAAAVRRHLAGLGGYPDLERLYRELGVATVVLGRRTGLTELQAEEMTRILTEPRED